MAIAVCAVKQASLCRGIGNLSGSWILKFIRKGVIVYGSKKVWNFSKECTEEDSSDKEGGKEEDNGEKEIIDNLGIIRKDRELV